MPIINLIYNAPQGWKPWANTLAYRPLKENLNDMVGSYSMTNSWVTFSDGVAQLSWSQRPTIPSLSLNWTRTISFWLYQTNTSSWMVLSRWDTNAFVQVYWGTVYIRWSWSWNTAISGSGLTNNAWHHIVIAQTTAKVEIYVDGVLFWSTTAQYLNWNMVGFCWSWNTWAAYAVIWKISEMIVEDKLWTAEDVAKYYNRSKANYWL